MSACDGTGAVVETGCRHGRFLCFRRDAYVGASLLTYGEWSEFELATLLRLVRPGFVVVEIGANIGAHSVPLARRAGRSGRFFAFEPQQGAFGLLAANLAINGLHHAQLWPMAAGAATGFAPIPLPDYEAPGNFGGVSLGAGAGRAPVVELGEFLDLERLDLLKIDVEGMEIDALSGAAALIRRTRPLIYLENDRRDRSAALIGAIHDLGYHAFWDLPMLYNPGNFRGEPRDIFPRLRSINMLCIPVERLIDTSRAIRNVGERPLVEGSLA